MIRIYLILKGDDLQKIKIMLEANYLFLVPESLKNEEAIVMWYVGVVLGSTVLITRKWLVWWKICNVGKGSSVHTVDIEKHDRLIYRYLNNITFLDFMLFLRHKAYLLFSSPCLLTSDLHISVYTSIFKLVLAAVMDLLCDRD